LIPLANAFIATEAAHDKQLTLLDLFFPQGDVGKPVSDGTL
jgi:hypothetical protein